MDHVLRPCLRGKPPFYNIIYIGWKPLAVVLKLMGDQLATIYHAPFIRTTIFFLPRHFVTKVWRMTNNVSITSSNQIERSAKNYHDRKWLFNNGLFGALLAMMYVISIVCESLRSIWAKLKRPPYVLYVSGENYDAGKLFRWEFPCQFSVLIKVSRARGECR